MPESARSPDTSPDGTYGTTRSSLDIGAGQRFAATSRGSAYGTTWVLTPQLELLPCMGRDMAPRHAIAIGLETVTIDVSLENITEAARQNRGVTETTTAVVVALAGGTGAFLGASVTALLTMRTQGKTHRREQLRRDAETLGPIRRYLEITIDPKRLAINAPVDDQSAQALHEKLLSQRDQHLAAVNVMAAGHPDSVVRATAKKFAIGLYNAGHSAGWMLRDALHDGRLRDAAGEDHQNALELLEKLSDLVEAYGEK